MYEFIAGNVVSVTDELAVIEAGGVGYGLRIPCSTRRALEGRAQARLHTALRIRDDQMHLFGFATLEEREVFSRLCTISGIGPGIALTILSGIPIDEFRVAVREGQVKVLERIKGIGRKTAQRIILELREVLVDTAAPGTSPWAPIAADAIGAMVAIGYGQVEAEAAVRAALEELPEERELETVVKLATRYARA